MQAQIIVDRFLRSICSLKYNLSVHERMLLTTISSYMGLKTECYPSHKSLAIYSGMSTASVIRHTQKLVEKELITISKSLGNNNIYCLSIPEDATSFSEQVLTNSNTSLLLSDTPVIADSKPNNIINNINQCTSVVRTKKFSAPKKNSSFPESFEISEKHQSMALQYSLDVKDEFAHFKDFHLSKGSTFAKWDSAFSTWLRNAKRFSKNKTASSSNSPLKDWS